MYGTWIGCKRPGLRRYSTLLKGTEKFSNHFPGLGFPLHYDNSGVLESDLQEEAFLLRFNWNMRTKGVSIVRETIGQRRRRYLHIYTPWPSHDSVSVWTPLSIHKKFYSPWNAFSLNQTEWKLERNNVEDLLFFLTLEWSRCKGTG